MSPRKSILRHLKSAHEQDPDGYTTPREIAGFDPADPKHTQAMAELRLINRRLEGKKKSESTLLKLFKKK